MDDETIFAFEETGNRAKIAASLRAITAQLSGSGPISLTADDETVSVHPSASIDFEVEIEREAEDGESHMELEIELEWREETERIDTTGDTDASEETERIGEAEDENEAVEGSEPRVETETVDLTAEHAPEESEGGDTGGVGSLGTFEVFRDRADEWRWRLVHRNGNVIATSGEGYTRRRNAEKGIRSVVENAPGADVVDDL